MPQICDTGLVFWDEHTFVLDILEPRTKHMYADVLDPAHRHRHRHHQTLSYHHHCHRHRHVSWILLLIKYLSRGQPPLEVMTVFDEAEVQTYLDDCCVAVETNGARAARRCVAEHKE